ncbi:DNA translocase FtsK [Patescibacteria group bacterium]|nr:DNA translocase FtsK [Patescibacteria group bacterium]
MAKKKKRKKNRRSPKKKLKSKEKPFKYPILTLRLRRWIGAILMFILSLVITFSFFERAGRAGQIIFKGLEFLVGKTIFFIPFLLVLGGLVILKPQKKRIAAPIFSGLLVLIIGISGILGTQNLAEKTGGWLGYIVAWPFLNYFGFAVSIIVFLALILIGGLILWEFLPKRKVLAKKILEEKEEREKEKLEVSKKEKPKFEIKPIEISQKKKEYLPPSTLPQEEKEEGVLGQIEAQPPEFPKEVSKYKFPLIELLDSKEETPSSGDIETNSLIIKKTLENFGITVEMSEVNIGPTVTQYTLKPAEGVKLSRIITLSNDLALALASHPIRIEAPIPGRALVGIEVPNKIRAKVKLGNLISSPQFQKSSFPLTFCLGKDVMGRPILQDLGKMPHFLVAGSTGSGKTICLNSLILSLIYRNSPKILRLILIDPKRVEFPVYNRLPHLLTPVIFAAERTVNALNWLTGEMERRFEILSESRTRDISSYNKLLKEKPKTQEQGFTVMPYIVLIIDELADLMASRGREVEGGIVRLSQLARAVGIHLVVATQRPSVEVITGLIKANITSRIAFQVASQVDSRTILDMAGAEKLLGWGDMLFISPALARPKRIQGSFVSTKEIKRVVNFIEKENIEEKKEEIEESLERGLQETEGKLPEISFEEDPLYEEAKRVVIEYRKASASLLQRRLKIGYARAARLLDMLEEKRVVGPADGAKPRKVYLGENPNDKIQNPKFEL